MAGSSRHAVSVVVGGTIESIGRSKFPPDVGAFISYVITDDVHHCGQIAMLARRLGPL
jgi:hypothetical protein